jgi:tellurite resistance protein
VGLLLGRRFCFQTTGRGVLHCYRCGGDRVYRRGTARRWFHLLYLPLVPLERVGEHVQCRTCRTRYRVEVLRLPTTVQMQAALPAATVVAATAMLRAGGRQNRAARDRAIDLIRAAGLADYDDAALTKDLAQALAQGNDISEALTALADQLMDPAPEWFLADAVRVGLADGPLSNSERNEVTRIAAHLGLSAVRAHGVISLTEQSAAAG